jgi:hypothetical protein
MQTNTKRSHQGHHSDADSKEGGSWPRAKCLLNYDRPGTHSKIALYVFPLSFEPMVFIRAMNLVLGSKLTVTSLFAAMSADLYSLNDHAAPLKGIHVQEHIIIKVHASVQCKLGACLNELQTLRQVIRYLCEHSDLPRYSWLSACLPANSTEHGLMAHRKYVVGFHQGQQHSNCLHKQLKSEARFLRFRCNNPQAQANAACQSWRRSSSQLASARYILCS